MPHSSGEVNFVEVKTNIVNYYGRFSWASDWWFLSASHWDDKIAWYENKDGQGDFDDTQLIISETINGASGIFAADIDGDGDNDVVAASSLDNYIVWFPYFSLYI